MAAIDTARSLAKKTRKQFSSLRCEERDGQFLLRLVGEQLALREIPGGGWRLICPIAIPASLPKGSDAKRRKAFKSVGAGLPRLGHAIELSCDPPEGKGAVESLCVFMQWATLDGLTPPELIEAINVLRTSAMYVRTQLRGLA